MNAHRCPGYDILFLDLGKNLFCCAMDSNTIGGEIIMPYSSLDGPNIWTRLGSLHSPHPICTLSIWNIIPQINVIIYNSKLPNHYLRTMIVIHTWNNKKPNWWQHICHTKHYQPIEHLRSLSLKYIFYMFY